MPSAKNSSITVAGLKARPSDVSATNSPSPLSPASTVPLLDQEVEGEMATPDATAASPKAASPIIAVDPTSTGISSGVTSASAALVVPAPPRLVAYENSNLDELTLRQLSEDIDAYKHDLAFCHAQLDAPDLTSQETRTFQLRTFDLSHQIRHSQHRIETIRLQMRGRPLRASYGAATGTANPGTVGVITNGTTAAASGKMAMQHVVPSYAPSGSKRPSPAAEDDAPMKRVRADQAAGSPDPHDASSLTMMSAGGDDDNLLLQRLGYWKCRLCEAPKYLLAGHGRTPAMPCKWPLKDISKMITHFTEMHAEHTPAERCAELGAALARNRGPFEYWLRRTRAHNIGDGSPMDECIAELMGGSMPKLLRRLSRAAAGMPVT